jgi:hypothetical protein
MRKFAMTIVSAASLVLGASQLAAATPAAGLAIKAAADAHKLNGYAGYYRSPYLGSEFYRPYRSYGPYRPYWGYGYSRPYYYRPYRRYRYGY